MWNVFEDIGANLTDAVFRGVYHGKTKHKDDFLEVLDRAWNIGMQKIILTGGYLEDCEEAIRLAKTNDKLYATVGCHPTRANAFEAKKSGSPQKYEEKLRCLIRENRDKVVAVDYDRLHFCNEEIQKTYFEAQFRLVDDTNLPLFLHSRNCRQDFYDIIKRNRERFTTGVVHSFTGSKEEIKELLDLDLYIGINGCSLKTRENIEAMCTIPSDRLMIETDAPWCEVKATHAGYQHVNNKFNVRKDAKKFVDGCVVKGRNETAMITHVMDVISKERGEDYDELADIIYNNTMKVFFKE